MKSLITKLIFRLKVDGKLAELTLCLEYPFPIDWKKPQVLYESINGNGVLYNTNNRQKLIWIDGTPANWPSIIERHFFPEHTIQAIHIVEEPETSTEQPATN